MFNVIPIAVFAGYLAFLFPLKKEKAVEKKDPKFEAQMKKLWQVAQSSMREKKPVRAEKALLTILKFDEKNAAAYNRLGILYAKDKKYNEAIECFEIAESLDNNASSLHNAGLIYLETGAYEKAVMALKQAIELEGDVAARYIALAKAEEKLGNKKNALENLETAYGLDHSTSTLRQILAIHENSGDAEKIAELTARIEQQIATDAKRREEKQSERQRVARHRSPVRMVSRAVSRGTASAKAGSTTTRSRAKKTSSPARTSTPRSTAKTTSTTTQRITRRPRTKVNISQGTDTPQRTTTARSTTAKTTSPSGVIRKRRRIRKVQ